MNQKLDDAAVDSEGFFLVIKPMSVRDNQRLPHWAKRVPPRPKSNTAKSPSGTSP